MPIGSDPFGGGTPRSPPGRPLCMSPLVTLLTILATFPAVSAVLSIREYLHSILLLLPFAGGGGGGVVAAVSSSSSTVFNSLSHFRSSYARWTATSFSTWGCRKDDGRICGGQL